MLFETNDIIASAIILLVLVLIYVVYMPADCCEMRARNALEPNETFYSEPKVYNYTDTITPVEFNGNTNEYDYTSTLSRRMGLARAGKY